MLLLCGRQLISWLSEEERREEKGSDGISGVKKDAPGLSIDHGTSASQSRVKIRSIQDRSSRLQ